MIAEKASDMIRDRDSVKAIKDYFHHLVAIKHDKLKDEEESEAVEQAINKKEHDHHK